MGTQELIQQLHDTEARDNIELLKRECRNVEQRATA